MTSASDRPVAPAIGRRLGAFLYEGVLAFGVVMLAGWLYAGLTQQRHALQGREGLMAFLVVVFAIYFVWFWTHGGQTVAMKTWRVRLVRADGRPLGQAQALLRYGLCYLWFIPGLAASWLAGLKTLPGIFGLLLANVLAYAATSRLHPQRQFLHDAILGTALVDAPVQARSAGR